MDPTTIILLNVITYMGGIFTGLGICFKYKKHLLIKTTSQDQLNELFTSIHHEVGTSTTMGPPISAPVAYASAPPSEEFKEVVIRTK